MPSHLLALLLLLAVPAWDIWEVRVLRRSRAVTARRDCYLRIVAVLWVLAGLALLIHPLSVYMAAPSSARGFFGGPALNIPASPVLLGVLLAAVLAPVLLSAVHAPTRTRFMAMFDALDFLLPRNKLEFWLFAAVSVSAGICEEILFRGFFLRYLAVGPWHLPLGAALVLSSVVFGLAHAGQGAKQALLTPVIGLLLGFLYVGTGSLLLPIILHACLDLRALAFAWMRSRQAGTRLAAS